MFYTTLQNFIHSDNLFSKKTWIALIFGLFFAGGVFGFIYETIFYIINNGELTRRGTCFGPWIDIYGFGALIIFFVAYWFRKKPWLVFILSGVLCGALEFVVGYAMYTLSGTRTWDYNTEIWNFGNIGGFVCLRSVLVFAAAGLLLFYIIIPILICIFEKIGERKFLILMVILGGLFWADVVYNDILAGMLSLPDAVIFYGRSGWYPIVTGYNGE